MALPYIIGAAAAYLSAPVLGKALTSAERASAQAFNALYPNATPDTTAAIAAWTRDFLTPEQASAISVLNGAAFGASSRGGSIKAFAKMWDKTAELLREQIPPGQILELANRKIITPTESGQLLTRYGGYSARNKELINRLRHQLPPISDVIRFAVKESFDEKVVNDLGYDNDFPAVLEAFASAQGYGLPSAASDDPALANYNISIPKLYWRSHWYPISPTQSYEMLHRIRKPFFAIRDGQPVELPAFTTDDVRRWLKISDYPPGIRDYLIQISYRPIGRIDIRRMVRVGFWTDRERILDAYKDLGYNETNSNELADYTILTEQKSEKGPQAKLRKAIGDSYDLGLIDRLQAYEQIISTYPDGVAPDKRAIEAQQILNHLDYDRKRKLISRAVTALRNDYLEGAVNREEARNQLLTMGIIDARVNDYLAAWSLDLTRSRRVASTDKVLEWFRRGLISFDDAKKRLTNIGWAEPDMFLFIESAEQDLEKARIAAEIRQARHGDSAARIAAAAAQRAKAADSEARANLMRQSSPAQMKRWYNRDLLSKDEIDTRLTQLGWAEDNRQRFLAELNGRV